MSRYLFGAVAALALVLAFTDAVDAQQRGRARGRGNRGANVVQRQRIRGQALRGQAFNRGRVFRNRGLRARGLFGFGGLGGLLFPQETVVVDAFGNVIGVARAPGLFGF